MCQLLTKEVCPLCVSSNEGGVAFMSDGLNEGGMASICDATKRGGVVSICVRFNEGGVASEPALS